MRKLAKMIRINFSRTLEMNQRFAAIWSMFIQEKWWNLSKNSKLCDILTCSILISLLPSSTVALKASSPQSWWKWAACSHQRRQNRVGALSKPFPQRTVMIWPSGRSLEDPAHRAIFIWSDLELTQYKKLFYIGPENRGNEKVGENLSKNN